MSHTLVASGERFDTPEQQVIDRRLEWALGQEVVSIIDGVSEDGRQRLVVNKLHTGQVRDPMSWHVTWLDLKTGQAHDDHVLRADVDEARQVWLQLVDPASYQQWPSGRHPAHFRPPAEQRRLQAKLDERYHAASMKHVRGIGDRGIHFAHIL